MQGNGVKPIVHTFALVVTFCLFLSACQSTPGQGEFYVYTDAQGNLVTIEKPVSEQAAEEAKEDSVETVDTSGADLLSAPLEDYRPSEEIDQELAAKERDRFITYVDESGQLVSRPVDMVAEKEAKKRVEPDYAELPGGDGLLLIDQPFSRKYPETWYRYGYLQGTLPHESGQRHLVVFLPYFQEQSSTDGLQAVLKGELLLSAQ